MSFPFASHPQVRCFSTFESWAQASFEGEINALCWPRTLEGDFQEIVDALPVKEGVVTLDMDWLKSTIFSHQGEQAKAILLQDYERLMAMGANPQIDAIFESYEDEVNPVIPTHVHSWHVDRAPVDAETYLCTYLGECSQGVSAREVVRKVDLPSYRQALLDHYGGADDAEFAELLEQECQDLHYELNPQARVYDFEVGPLWKISVLSPEGNVAACVHRAPYTSLGDQPRLLLIG